MHRNRRLFFLYLVNAGLLLTHEIDSAYWKEWNLFGLPGGIQFFLVLNFLMVVAALYGLAEVVKETQAGIYYSFALAVVGVFAFSIHSYFLLTGHPEFHLPASLFVLAATLPISIAQFIFAMRAILQPNR